MEHTGGWLEMCRLNKRNKRAEQCNLALQHGICMQCICRQACTSGQSLAYIWPMLAVHMPSCWSHGEMTQSPYIASATLISG